MKEWHLSVIIALSAIVIGYGLGLINADAQVFGDYDREYAPGNTTAMTLERLVIIDPATKRPRIILRTIDGMPAIIFLYSNFETEAKAVLDFRSGRTTEPKSIVGGGRRE